MIKSNQKGAAMLKPKRTDVDLNSEEFKNEEEKTKKFVEKVVKQFGWCLNPNKEVYDAIVLGLTRNKLMYGKRYCPCFIPMGDKEDRICPCKPAIDHEVAEGCCHCGIFCNPNKCEEISKELNENG
jgi:ferredoxin-thioredoxin reductase catalytic subunit